MLRFAVRRLLLLFPILFGLSILLFAWIRALPGGPATALLGPRGTPALVEQINEAYGFDRPLHEQYLSYIGRVVQLDLGTSIRTRQPVTAEIARLFPATAELALTALLIAVAVGVPLGYFAARRHGRLLDHMTVGGSLIGIAIPVFFLGFMLKYVFAVKLGWLPSTGRQDARMDAEHPTGFYVIDGLVTGNLAASWDAVQHLILPGIALASIPLAIITRITRASVLDVVHEDYVRTAEAKGLLKETITRRHVLRNALMPVSTITGLQLGLLLSGAILTERVFAFQGVGTFIYESITNRDFPILQGFILAIAVIMIVVNLLVDISYGLLDPRVRIR